MILAQLALEKYRNLVDQKLTFSDQANIISGKNGQGKSNLLEAIFLLSSTRSYRTPLTREVIQWGSEGFRLAGEVRTNQKTLCLEIHHTERARKLQINRNKRDIFDYLGYLNVHVFSSSQLERFRGDSEQRRKFIDRGLYWIQPLHLRRLADYSRLLRQKNSLLRSADSIYNSRFGNLLDSWDQKIAEIGAEIIVSRSDYVEKIRDQLVLDVGTIAPERMSIRYRPCNEISPGKESEKIRLQLISKISLYRDREIRLKRSLVGPHRDDLNICVDGSEMERYSSAGQQKSAFLACQLAQMELHYHLCREYPVFLIDDVDSELDNERMNRVIELIGRKMQIFVTTTRPETIQLKDLGIAPKRFTIEAGAILQN